MSRASVGPRLSIVWYRPHSDAHMPIQVGGRLGLMALLSGLSDLSSVSDNLGVTLSIHVVT